MTTSGERPPRVATVGFFALAVTPAGDEQPCKLRAGGTAGNVTAGLAGLGAEVLPVARLDQTRAAAGALVVQDLERWHVDTRHVESEGAVPIVCDGRSFRCPICGSRTPQQAYRLRLDRAEEVVPQLEPVDVLFVDRVWPGVVQLAEQLALGGTLVVFEPISIPAETEAFHDLMAIAHIVKFSAERLAVLASHSDPASVDQLRIMTRAGRGLRYTRRRAGERHGRWTHLSAHAVPHVASEVGAGDWCTVGLLTELLTDFRARPGAEVVTPEAQRAHAALEVGQALAAWSVGFDTARGGMEGPDWDDMPAVVEGLLGRPARFGARRLPAGPQAELDGTTGPLCPRCPASGRSRGEPGRPRRRGGTGGLRRVC